MDRETIGVYDARHGEYVSRFGDQGPSDSLQAFAGGLSAGQQVLDLGCGPGNAARSMAAMGLSVTALDASEGMIARVRDIEGVEAIHADFFWLDQHRAAFHGIWANFSLLHAAEDELDLHLDAIRAALLPSGRLHLGMKTGSGPKRDHLWRRYAYFSRNDLLARLQRRGFSILSVHEGEEVGLAGTPDPFVLILVELSEDSEAV